MWFLHFTSERKSHWHGSKILHVEHFYLFLSLTSMHIGSLWLQPSLIIYPIFVIYLFIYQVLLPSFNLFDFFIFNWPHLQVKMACEIIWQLMRDHVNKKIKLLNKANHLLVNKSDPWIWYFSLDCGLSFLSLWLWHQSWDSLSLSLSKRVKCNLGLDPTRIEVMHAELRERINMYCPFLCTYYFGNINHIMPILKIENYISSYKKNIYFF